MTFTPNIKIYTGNISRDEAKKLLRDLREAGFDRLAESLEKQCLLHFHAKWTGGWWLDKSRSIYATWTTRKNFDDEYFAAIKAPAKDSFGRSYFTTAYLSPPLATRSAAKKMCSRWYHNSSDWETLINQENQ